MALLKAEDIQQRAKDWNFENKSISRDFSVKDFQSAIALIIKIAFEAEKMDHHPDIYLHSYNKIRVTLSTHNEGGVTEKDIKLAEKIADLV